MASFGTVHQTSVIGNYAIGCRIPYIGRRATTNLENAAD